MAAPVASGGRRASLKCQEETCGQRQGGYRACHQPLMHRAVSVSMEGGGYNHRDGSKTETRQNKIGYGRGTCEPTPGQTGHRMITMLPMTSYHTKGDQTKGDKQSRGTAAVMCTRTKGTCSVWVLGRDLFSTTYSPLPYAPSVHLSKAVSDIM